MRRPRPATYREALNALRDAHLALGSILAATRLPQQQAREQLQLLADRLLALLNRDDDRTR